MGLRRRSKHRHTGNSHRSLLVGTKVDINVCFFLKKKGYQQYYLSRFTGTVEDQVDSKVTLGVCNGLSGLILSNNQTLLLEAVWQEDDESEPSSLIHHVIYPTTIDLNSDQDYGNLIKRMKRNIKDQLDYDEEGNAITDTVNLSDWFHEYENDRDDDEDETNNLIDGDDVLISDTYSEIDEYDVHLPPIVTEAKSLAEAENIPNQTTAEPKKDEVDGYSVDKLWEGIRLFI